MTSIGLRYLFLVQSSSLLMGLYIVFNLIYVHLFLAEEAGVRLPGKVRRGAARPGAAVHQHLPEGPKSKTSCPLTAVIVVDV